MILWVGIRVVNLFGLLRVRQENGWVEKRPVTLSAVSARQNLRLGRACLSHMGRFPRLRTNNDDAAQVSLKLEVSVSLLPHAPASPAIGFGVFVADRVHVSGTWTYRPPFSNKNGRSPCDSCCEPQAQEGTRVRSGDDSAYMEGAD